MSMINSSCLILTLVLVLCYSFSTNTYNRVRPSLLVSKILSNLQINALKVSSKLIFSGGGPQFSECFIIFSVIRSTQQDSLHTLVPLLHQNTKFFCIPCFNWSLCKIYSFVLSKNLAINHFDKKFYQL